MVQFDQRKNKNNYNKKMMMMDDIDEETTHNNTIIIIILTMTITMIIIDFLLKYRQRRTRWQISRQGLHASRTNQICIQPG
jgi:hypothetical protein